MTRKTARDFDPQVLKLFDDYVHGRLSRRGFLENAGRLVVAGVTAESLLMALSPNFALGQQVPPQDARLKTDYEEFPSSPEGCGEIRAYVARPAKAKGKLPTILVVHENRGLNPHIEDIVRRLALDNFIAGAPTPRRSSSECPGRQQGRRAIAHTMGAAHVPTVITHARCRIPGSRSRAVSGRLRA